MHDFTEEQPLIQQIIDESDLILFVIDDSVGVTAKEQQIFSYITKKNKKKDTILIINKVDIKHKEKDYDLAVNDYFDLGFDHIIGISAKKGNNLEEVRNVVAKALLKSSPYLLDKGGEPQSGGGLEETKVDLPATKDTKYTHIAIIGKPNAGKSTLLNTLVGKPLAKVENIP